MAEFRMPSLGADMEEGTVVEWLVNLGDSVTHGDIIATIDTDKAEIDVETFDSGVVEEILVKPGQKVPVGTPLAIIRVEAPFDTAPPSTPPPVAAPPPPPTPEVSSPPPAAPPVPPAVPTAEHRQRVSPLARRTATELGVDLSTVTATSPDGAITSADVERAASGAPAPPVPRAPRPAPAESSAKPDRAAAMQRAIAAAMSKSHREIPHYYLSDWIDMSSAIGWLDETNRERSVQNRLLYSALLMRAVVLATRKVPEVNGHWADGAFEPSEAVHLGVGVSLPGGGLIAPAILNADQLDLDGLMLALRDLVGRARGGGLRGSELTEGTITVTNLGERGVETVFGLIYPPQVALVGFGKLVEQPWAEDGLIGARPQIHASLSGDHRASNGHRGARFLAAIDRLLQHPEAL